MGTKSFVQIEINAVFTTTSGKMQFRSGVFDHFNSVLFNLILLSAFLFGTEASYGTVWPTHVQSGRNEERLHPPRVCHGSG
jgi:hypothetical protein